MEIRLRKKVAFAAITQVAILATVESTLRATGFRRPTNPVEFVGANLGADKFREWDDTVFWRMRPHAEIPGCSERLNERGFRGPDRSVAKVAGVKRIVCLGDSCTFGSMVGGTVTFSHVLERWIVDHGGSVEVVNLGVPGYSALQILRQLRSVALPLTPDVVVVYAGAWNDFTPAIRFDDRTIAAQVDAQSRSWSALSMGSLRIVDGCRAIVASNHVVAASTAETFAMGFALRHELPDGPRMPCAPFRETLAEISRDARAAGASVVFVVPPAPASTRRKFPESDAYAAIVRDVATSSGDRVVDARAAFAAVGESDTPLFEDAIHPSGCGHSWIAAGIASELAALRWPELEAFEPDAMVDPLPLELSAAMEPAGCEVGVERVPDHATVAARTPVTLRSASVVVPEGSRLRTAFGWVGERSSGSVRFRVAVEDGETSTRLFERDLAEPADTEAHVGRETIDLSAYEGRSVRFLFSATGGSAVAYWIRPKVGRFPPG